MLARRTLTVSIALAVILGGAMTAPSSGRSGDVTPRWVKHIERYPGGISGGVRAMASPEAVAARAALRSKATTAPHVPGGPNVQMNDDSNPPLPQNETTVAYSLDDPMVAVAAANDYVSNASVIMRTADGGRHWASTRLSPVFRYTGDVCSGGDPSVAYSRRDHAFYFTQLCFFRASNVSELHLFKSVDDGRTWTPGRQRALAATNFDYEKGTLDESIFNDKEYLTVDNFPGDPHYGRIYITFTRFHIRPSGFSDSCPIVLSYTDNVPTFDPSLAVFHSSNVQPDDPGGNGRGRSANQFSVPVVEHGGTLDVAFVREGCNDGIDRHWMLQKSIDGGASFLADPIRVDPAGSYVPIPYEDGLLPTKKFRVPNTLSLAYSEATGTLAYVYTNFKDAGTSGADIALQRSIDGGLTWSPPKTISKKPASSAGARNDQFFPWASFTPSGRFYAIWLDCRRDPANHMIDTWQAVSEDDANADFTNERISSASWDPDRGFFTSASFIGDYSGLAANDSAVYAVWPDARDSAIDDTGIGETDIFTDVQLTGP